VHGDLYAHNLLVNEHGQALLGDFGAASFVPPGDAARAERLRLFDRRALACLVDEIAKRCDDPAALHRLRPADAIVAD
jgi:serine/threonine protein kinase